MPLTGFEIQTVVLCDEVRQETSGKAIIIGAMGHGPEVYDDEDTNIKQLAIYVAFNAPCDPLELQFRLIKDDQEEPVMSVDVDLSEIYNDAPSPDTWKRNPIAIVVFGRENFSLKGSGDYQFQYSTEEGNWISYKEFYFPEKHKSE